MSRRQLDIVAALCISRQYTALLEQGTKKGRRSHLEEGCEEERQVLHKILVLRRGRALVCFRDVCVLGDDVHQHVHAYLKQVVKVGIVLYAYGERCHLHSRKVYSQDGSFRTTFSEPNGLLA